MPNFAGKVAIVTGASSGIGAATAVHFAKLGCSMVLTGRIEENLKKTNDACIKAGLNENKIALIVTDVTATDGPDKIVNAAKQKFGKLDILVNNAAIFKPGGICDTDIDSYDEQFNINLRSVVILTKKCLPMLIESKGSIVNVSSIAGLEPYIVGSYYAMTKAAINMFTKCLAMELGPKAVRVNAVNPGFVETPIWWRALGNAEDVAKAKQIGMDSHPLAIGLNRVGQPEDVAKVIAFLASDESGFTTGETVRSDGGMDDLTVYTNELVKMKAR